MNIDTTVIAAAPLVTELLWVLAGVAVGVVMVVAAIRSGVDGPILLAFAVVIAAVAWAGLLLASEASEGGGKELDASSVNEPAGGRHDHH